MAMVELNKVERRAIVLVLAFVLGAAWVRWRQAEATRVELTVESAESSKSLESEEAKGVQR